MKIKDILPEYVFLSLDKLDKPKKDQLNEIRLRIGRPVYVYISGEEYALSESGITKNDGIIFSQSDAARMWQKLCCGAPYSCTQQQRNGYMTVEGNRIGFCGEFAFKEDEIKHIQNIYSFCVRIMHQVKGCGNKVYKYLFENNVPLNTLIVSPPGCGKTTLLRDIIRLYANDGFNVSVVDVRDEICACVNGVPTLDVGKRTDVFCGCSKQTGISNMVRSLKPDIIGVDEIASEDIGAIKDATTQGISVIATAHGRSVNDAVTRLGMQFDRYIVLSSDFGIGTVKGVYDQDEEIGSFKLCC